MCSIVIYNHCLVLLMLSFMYFTTERWCAQRVSHSGTLFISFAPHSSLKIAPPAGARARGAAGAGAAGAGFH